MTKLFKRRRARPLSSSAAEDQPKPSRSKVTTKAASISSHAVKSNSSQRNKVNEAVETASQDESDIEVGFDLGDSEAANAVLDALAGWRDETTRAVEMMTSEPGQTGARQVAAHLNEQRQVLEQVKAALTEMQRMIEACETDLKQDGEKQTMALPSFVTGFMPKGAAAAMQVPMQVSMAPVTAIWSMQKAALSGVGMWTKAAQDYHGMWVGAVQSMVPGNGKGSSNGRHQDPERTERRSVNRDED